MVRMRRMLDTILVPLIALLLLILCLFFLPLGFTKMGKMILICLSGILAAIAFMTNTMFHLWQTAVILFLLAISFSYLILKRFSARIFIEPVYVDNDEGFHDVITSQPIINPQLDVKDDDDIMIPLLQLDMPKVESDIEDHVNHHHEEIVEQQDILLNNSDDMIDPLPNQIDKKEESNEESHHIEMDDDLDDFFENRSVLLDSLEEKKEEQLVEQPLDDRVQERLNEDVLADDNFIIEEIDFNGRKNTQKS